MSTKINEEKIKSNLGKIKKLRAILAGKDPADIEKKEKQNNKNLIKKELTNNNKASKLEQENEGNLDEEENNDNNNSQKTKEIDENQNNNVSAANQNFVVENNSSINLNLNLENQNNNYEKNNLEVEAAADQNNNQSQNLTGLEIKKIQKQIFVIKKKTAAELITELYDLLQIDDPKAYQPKMKGFVIPFYSEKVNIRLPDNSPGKKIIKSDPISQENLKRILKERKEQKFKELDEKKKIEKINIIEGKKKAKFINEKIKNNITNNYDKLYATKDKIPNKYTDIKKKQENNIKEKDTKITWDQLENLNFNHFITNREDDFNPNDLFDDIYDSDDENIFDEIQHTEKKTLKKTIKSKDIESSYLNIQANINIKNNNFSNNHANETAPDSIIKSYSGKTRQTANVHYSARAINNDINIGNPNIQSAVKNLNTRKQSGNINAVIINNHRNNNSLHSSNERNNSNLSIILDNESNKAYNKNVNHRNYVANDSYEMQKRSPRNKSPKGNRKTSDVHNVKINRNSNASANVKNLIVRKNSPKKVLNKSIEKSAQEQGNKNKRSSSKSNIQINQNQRYIEVQSPKSIKELNNEKINRQMYSIEKTEKMARELEKNREDQKSRVDLILAIIYFFNFYIYKTNNFYVKILVDEKT